MKALKWQKAIYVYFSEDKLSSVSKEWYVTMETLVHYDDALPVFIAWYRFWTSLKTRFNVAWPTHSFPTHWWHMTISSER